MYLLAVAYDACSMFFWTSVHIFCTNDRFMNTNKLNEISLDGCLSRCCMHTMLLIRVYSGTVNIMTLFACYAAFHEGI
jgi:hypothetical protein